MIIDLSNKGLTKFDLEEYCLENNIDIDEVRELYLHDNKLTELKLPENSKILWLYLHNNELKEFKLPENSNARWLDLSNNPLKQFKFPKNSKIDYFFLDEGVKKIWR